MPRVFYFLGLFQFFPNGESFMELRIDEHYRDYDAVINLEQDRGYSWIRVGLSHGLILYYDKENFEGKCGSQMYDVGASGTK